MSELLAEYGEQDVHWKTNKSQKKAEDSDSSKNVPFKSRLKPLSDLLAEYGEQDVDWKKQQHPQQEQGNNASSRSISKQANNNKKQSNKTEDNGMLAPFGKAPIHLEIMSCKCSLIAEELFFLYYMCHHHQQSNHYLTHVTSLFQSDTNTMLQRTPKDLAMHTHYLL